MPSSTNFTSCLFLLLLAAFPVVACNEDSTSAPAPSSQRGNGGSSGNPGATSGTAFAACAIPANAVSSTKSCSAAGDVLCQSIWGGEVDANSCLGTVGANPCSTEGALGVCLDESGGKLTVYRSGHEALVGPGEQDCATQNGKWCAAK